MSLRQGDQLVADFSVDFRTKARRSDWNSASLCDAGSRLGAPESMQRGQTSLTPQGWGYLCLLRRISVCAVARPPILSLAVW